MNKYSLYTLLFAWFINFSTAEAQHMVQKNDHLFSGRFGLDYRQVPNNLILTLGMTVDWQYLITNKWSIGLGIRMTNTSNHYFDPQYGQNSYQQNFILSPSILATRFYNINEKWAFALVNEVNYFKSSLQTHLSYTLSPAVYYKFKPHWLISAQTNLAAIAYIKPFYDLTVTNFSITVGPTLDAFMPVFSLSYLL